MTEQHFMLNDDQAEQVYAFKDARKEFFDADIELAQAEAAHNAAIDSEAATETFKRLLNASGKFRNTVAIYTDTREAVPNFRELDK